MSIDRGRPSHSIETPRFDPLTLPLEGTQLIEASAGTGKTYTITHLLLRLLLEGGGPLDRILVVTYTVAATEELKGRIRQLLRETAATLASGGQENLLINRLLAQQSREQIAERLRSAQSLLDRAPIYTIHGFCQRVLSDNAFDGALPFEVELLTDEGELQREVMEDFWRLQTHRSEPLWTHYLIEKGVTPATLLERIGPLLARGEVELIGPEGGSEADYRAVEAALLHSYREAREIWLRERESIAELLLMSPALDRRRFRPGLRRRGLAELADFFRPNYPHGLLPRLFARFTQEQLQRATKPGERPPNHGLFVACENLLEEYRRLESLFAERRLVLELEALTFVRKQLSQRKRQARIHSYDDLLGRTHQALHSAQGESLARALRARFSAALIDEFQDTDRIQYQIFSRIFRGSHGPLILVGDPKQSIYAFRGADIFAYLAARDEVERVHSLQINWRSAPQLVEAVNRLFSRAARPFLFRAIPYPEVAAARRRQERLHEQRRPTPPLLLWWMAPEGGKQRLPKARAEQQAAAATATEIARLIEAGELGRAYIERPQRDGEVAKQPLSSGDIAVLVRTHRQGELVRAELAELGIVALQQSQESVYRSAEAGELERLLIAITEPQRSGRLRAVLAGPLFALDATTLQRLEQDEAAWERWLLRFQRYRELWRDRGVLVMLRRLLLVEQVPQRLLAQRDGERALTNLLHLCELLQELAGGERAEGVIEALALRRGGGVAESGSQLLRLESDRATVRVITIHHSKGLEFPVVFCPFLWDGRVRAADEAIVFSHELDGDSRPLLDFGSARQEWRRQIARREELAENLRLAYVALTRAKHRCYVAWGAISQAESAALAWLWHQPEQAKDGDGLERLIEAFSAASPMELRAQLERIVAAAPNAIRLEPIPLGQARLYLPQSTSSQTFNARRFDGVIPPRWWITSFSALSSGQHGAEGADYDAIALESLSAPPSASAEKLEPASSTIADFPRGARAGSCLHALFEELDFVTPSAVSAVTESALTRFGFSTEWVSPVERMFEEVIHTPLMATFQEHSRMDAISGQPQSSCFQLSQIGWEQRINELGFYFPIDGLEPEWLADLLRQHADAEPSLAAVADHIQFEPLSGFVKGFIDLTFEIDGRYYLADYKSNWLGEQPADYHTTALDEAMLKEGYHLQYLIYSVALHRYLKLRLRDYHYDQKFGGVFYLFLRGMSATECTRTGTDGSTVGSTPGVWFTRPPRALIEALDRRLSEVAPM